MAHDGTADPMFGRQTFLNHLESITTTLMMEDSEYTAALDRTFTNIKGLSIFQHSGAG